MKPLTNDTPLAQAIFEMLSELAEIAEEHYISLPSGSIRAFIFGGCAVHIYTNARGSNDLDIQLEASMEININEIILEMEDIDYIDTDGSSKLCYTRAKDD